MKLWNTVDEITDEWLESTEPEYTRNGELIFYSGLFRWSDGSIHDEPEDENIQ